MEQTHEHRHRREAEPVVTFSKGNMGVIGVVGGIAFATTFAWIVLTFGAVMGSGMQAGLVIASLAVGGTIALTSAFFSLVIPDRVMPHDHHHRHHGHAHGHGRDACGRRVDDDDENDA